MDKIFNIISSPKMINSFKTALACLLGYLLMVWTSLPQSEWIVITIMVVMSAQTSIGSLFIKAKMRFWGTVCGALASLGILLICGTNPVGIGISLFIIALFFTYIAGTPGDVSYVGTLGSVTVAIIILNPGANLLAVGERFIEIILGILISFLVSYFVFPIRSHSIFLTNLGNTLSYLGEYFESCFTEPIPDLNSSFQDLNEKILNIFSQQRRLIQETGLEFGKTRKNKTIFQLILNSERKVYRALNLIYYSLHATTHTRKSIQSLEGFDEFKKEVKYFLLLLAEKVKAKDPNLNFIIKDYGEMMDQYFETIIQDTDYKHISNINTFLFSVHFLIKELKELQLTISKINY